MDRLDELRADWHRASEKDKPHDAVKALRELEKLEPHEPRWSQRLGEACRRLDQTAEAVEAFARAFERYFARGFLPRAIAMAKLVAALDAARGDLLERKLPKGGPGVPPPLSFGRPVGNAPSVPVAITSSVTARAVPEGPKPARVAPAPVSEPAISVAPSRRARPVPLARAEDAATDEVRFADAPDSSIEILLAEFASEMVVNIDVEEDPLPTAPPAPPESHHGEALEPPEEAYAKMATFRLFASLSRDALVALSNAAELVEFVPSAMIIVRDERAFALYAIVSGTARVHVTGSKTEVRLGEGDIFGESSLLDEGQRQADVRAETPLMTLRIEKHTLDGVMKDHPEVEDALFDLLARRLITNLMHTSPLFAAFESSVRLELAQKFEVRRADAGTVLADRGRRSDGLYVLLAGNVMAEPESGAPTRIARGTVFGHASLLGAAAGVTVRTATEAVLLRMPAAGFASLAALYPPALAHLAETAHEPLPMSRREP